MLIKLKVWGFTSFLFEAMEYPAAWLHPRFGLSYQDFLRRWWIQML